MLEESGIGIVNHERTFFLSLFILRERDSMCVQASRGEGWPESEKGRERERKRERERERERTPSSLHAVSTEPNMGLKVTICEIMI